MQQLPSEIWQQDIVPYLNTDNRTQLRGTRQSIAKRVPQTPVCTPWECVWRPTLCLEKCDRFWLNTKNLLEKFLRFLHGQDKGMIVGFDMMGSRLLLYWIPQVDLFLRHRDIHPFLKNGLIPERGTYYQQVITDYFSKIQSKAQKRGVKSNAEDDEPFKLQLIVTTDPWHTGSTYLHESVRHEFCGPQLGNLYVYDVSTPESVSILITDYPPTKAKTLIPIVDVDGEPMAHKPLWESCT